MMSISAHRVFYSEILCCFLLYDYPEVFLILRYKLSPIIMNINIKEITEALKKFNEIEFAYIFGSHASGSNEFK